MFLSESVKNVLVTLHEWSNIIFQHKKQYNKPKRKQDYSMCHYNYWKQESETRNFKTRITRNLQAWYVLTIYLNTSFTIKQIV